MKEVLAECLKDILVMGNLDPVGIFKYSTPDKVVALQTKKLLSETVGYAYFIISSGCDVPLNIPFENIEAFFRSPRIN